MPLGLVILHSAAMWSDCRCLRVGEHVFRVDLQGGHADVSVVLLQLPPKEVDPTLATGALNNIIADNNLTAQFGSLQSAALSDNNTQALLNQTLGPLHLYPLRIGGGAMAICNESFLTPRQYYALDVAYSSRTCFLWL